MNTTQSMTESHSKSDTVAPDPQQTSAGDPALVHGAEPEERSKAGVEQADSPERARAPEPDAGAEDLIASLNRDIVEFSAALF